MCLPGLDLPGRGLHELGLSGCDPFGRGLTVHVRPNGYGILKFNIQQFRLFMTETLIILFIIFYGKAFQNFKGYHRFLLFKNVVLTD